MHRVILTFDQSAADFVIDAFDKAVDADGYLVEKTNPRQRVLTIKGEELLRKQFAGVRKGSDIFLKSDIDSIIDAADHISD